MDVKTKCDIGDTIFFKQGEELIKAIISKIEIEIEKKEMTISYFTETDNKENVIVEEHEILGRAI